MSLGSRLRRHGPVFLQHLDDSGVLGQNLKQLAEGLINYLKYELQSQEHCELFWKGIKPALSGCPKDEHFTVYANILAYGFVHLLDRYIRVWEVLRWLVRRAVLPVPRRHAAVLDIGSGPAPALYATADFYQALDSFAVKHEVPRLAVPQLELHPIELSDAMCHFFHNLSEFAGKQGPFRPLLSDFGTFNPDEQRETALRMEQARYEEGWGDFATRGELRTWATTLDRYQLVLFSNFLTTPVLAARFSEQTTLAFNNQRRGGVVVVLGGVGPPYPEIYESLEGIALKTGHRRIGGIPEVFDDSFRRPYFGFLKAFNDSVWDVLHQACDTDRFERSGYPPYWDKAKPIRTLSSFAVRVYRRVA